MTAETILQKIVRHDRVGNPHEVVIPYEDLIDFIETYGLELSDDEKEAIREAQENLTVGMHEKFVTAEDAKRQLGL